MTLESRRASGSMASRAYATLRERLVNLDIAPGQPLDDDELSRELQMGRTPIREAFKRLETEGLVIAYPKRGTFATPIEMTDQANIQLIRERLEPLAASLAARKASETQRAGMQGLVLRLQELNPTSVLGTDILDIDSAVHAAIYAASANPFLDDTLTRLRALSSRIWHVGLAGRARAVNLDEVREHIDLLGAVVDREPERAASAMVRHMTESDRRFEAQVRA